MYPVDPAALDPVSVEVADALALLRRLHIGRNRRPIAETITMLLEAVRAHAGIALSPTGDGYLNELHHQPEHREAALINRDADCKHDQRKRGREHRRAFTPMTWSRRAAKPDRWPRPVVA
jgi:hypothetical protein